MTIDKTALWERLRNDPDFTPEWFLTIGHLPPDEPGTHREWADAPPEGHVIAAMSWSEGWTECATCGVTVRTDGGQAEHIRLWGLHTGNTDYREPRVKRDQLATDDEVSSFLAGLSGTAPDVGSLQGGTPPPEDGHEDCEHGVYCAVAYRVLLRVLDMGDAEFDALYPEEVAA